MELEDFELFNYNELRDRYEGDVDVYVKIDDSVYIGTFETFNSFRKNLINNKKYGNFLNGMYLPGSYILIEEITYETVEMVINDMLENGTFDSAFSLVDLDDL